MRLVNLICAQAYSVAQARYETMEPVTIRDRKASRKAQECFEIGGEARGESINLSTFRKLYYVLNQC